MLRAWSGRPSPWGQQGSPWGAGRMQPLEKRWILGFAAGYKLPGRAQLAVAAGPTLHISALWSSLPLPHEPIHRCQLFWFIHGWLTSFLKQGDANL